MGPVGPDGTRETPPLDRRVVAIKIVRDRPDYVQDAKDELEILRNLIEHDKEDRYPFIKPLRTFWHGNHFCILFPKFGGTLLDFLQKHGRFTLEFVAQYSYRLFTTLLFLHRECRLTHTDLKPENILLELRGYSHRQRKRVPRSYGIRIIDFGSATHEDEFHGRIVSTRHYRAPEVVLGSGWSYPADIWSVGCILYELLTGEMLFDTHDDRQHLAMMERVLEQPLLRPATINPDVAMHFNPDGTLRPLEDPELLAAVRALRPLRQTMAAWPMVLQLVLRCLCLEPNERITAEGAMRDSFVSSVDGSATPPPSRTLGAPEIVPKLVPPPPEDLVVLPKPPRPQ